MIVSKDSELTSVDQIIAQVTGHSNQAKKKVFSVPKPNEENWPEVLEMQKISATENYTEPPVCIEVEDFDGLKRFGTLGNFSAIIGKAKSRKSFFTSFILSAAINKKSSAKVKVVNSPTQNKVIVFDTEQSSFDVARILHRVRQMGGNSDNLSIYCLRAFTPDDRLFLIERAIYNTDGLLIVLIDGLRDLVKDINNAEEATLVTSKLMKWTEERNLHIVSVLHQNKGDNHARGHLGSEVVNKAETVISVEKDGDVSIVQTEFCRGKDFAPFAFSIDGDGLPYILDDWSPKTAKSERKRITPYDFERDAHLNMLRKVFTEVDVTKKYKELETEIKVAYQSCGVNLSNNQVVDFITFYKKEKYIKDSGGKGRQGNSYSLNI